jgi:hypothetical protein
LPPWGDVIGLVQIALVDLGPRHEAVDVHGVGAFNFHRLELVLLDFDVAALAQLVAASFLVAFDDTTSVLVDHLLPQPVAGPLVDLVEVGLLGLR